MERVRDGFKVVTLIGGFEYCSSSGSYLRDYARRYRIGEWTTRHEGCGPLAVFSTFDEADVFAESNKLIFSCKYVPSRNKTLWVPEWRMSARYIPQRTRFAEKVMLVEYIRRNDIR